MRKTEARSLRYAMRIYFKRWRPCIPRI